MKSLGIPFAVIAALSLGTFAHANTRDVQGSSDFVDLPRVSNSHIRAYRTYGNAEALVPTAAIASRRDDTEKTKHMQGQITHRDYVVRPAQPAADIDRYFEENLRSRGYETVFTCSGISVCGSRMGSLILNEGLVSPVGFADGLFNDRLQVRVARKGSTWVLLHMIQGPDRALVYQAVIEGARELE